MHTHKPGLVCHWTIHLDREHYATVFIWESRDILEKTNKITKAEGYACSMGCMVDVDKGMVRIPKKFGEIHLIHNKYGAGTVAHEVTHLVTFYINAKGWNLSVDTERIANVAERLTRDFWNGHYKNFE